MIAPTDVVRLGSLTGSLTLTQEQKLWAQSRQYIYTLDLILSQTIEG